MDGLTESEPKISSAWQYITAVIAFSTELRYKAAAAQNMPSFTHGSAILNPCGEMLAPSEI